MYDTSKLRLILLGLPTAQAMLAVAVIAGFSMTGCDKVEGLVQDVKSQVADDGATVADAPGTAPASPAPTMIAPPQPVVPAGPTAEEIVAQFTQLRPDQISDGSLAQLAAAPEAAAAITEIDMRGAQVSGTGLSHLASLPNLQSLTVSGPRITADALTAVGKSQSLRNVDLSGSSANDQVVSELSQIPHLQSLNLEGTSVTGGSAVGLGSMRELTELSLVGTAVNDQVVASISSLPLRKLDLSKTPITNASLPHILKIETLEELDVSFTSLTGANYKGFGKTNIKVLNVGMTPFGLDGFVNIKGMKDLEDLNVYSAGLVEHKAANVFRTFPKLKILNAGKNSVTDEGMVVFFKGHGTLEDLQLHDNRGITDRGLGALIGVTTLKSLNVGGTACGAAGAQALKRILPECTIKTASGVF